MKNDPGNIPLDVDMRNVYPALVRAGKRARELAQRTGTRVVVMNAGRIQYLQPKRIGVSEPKTPYGEE